MGKRWAVKATVDRLLAQAKIEVAKLGEIGVQPHLAVILIGENPASKVYVSSKVRTCEELGIRSTLIAMPAEVTQADLLARVDELNQDPSVHGILVQLPLPKHIEESAVIHRIDPDKDVDGFHPVNVGRLSLGERGLFPCTPMGVMALLADAGVDLRGKHAVVVGRSNIVGKPMAQLLLAQHCTVTIVHSRTPAPEALCRQADIVVAAVGRPGLVRGSWIKPGALVVDVGINELVDGAEVERLVEVGSKKWEAFQEKGRVLYGDVHYNEALEIAAFVSPVPGGVGALTIAHLMVNCVMAAQWSAAQ
jgi:methylenetetrahydrofolate dehydrogenase (NADP+) / methenyltetrahydrofolate cyclohydrolase